jgi:hypothetical protein
MRQHASILAVMRESRQSAGRRIRLRRVCWPPLALEMNYVDEPAKLCKPCGIIAGGHRADDESAGGAGADRRCNVDASKKLATMPRDFLGLSYESRNSPILRSFPRAMRRWSALFGNCVHTAFCGWAAT